MNNIKKYIALSILVSIGFICPKLSFSQTETFGDIALRAMQDEMDKNLSNLKLDKLKSPYYISYFISDANLYSVETQLGQIVRVIDKPYRNQETTVLVGDHKKNNLNFVNENKLFGWYGGAFNIPLSLENNYDAIRRSLWIETDLQYKEAAEMTEAKLSSIKQQNLPQEEIDLIDFTTIPSLNKVLPSKNISFNKTQIESLTKELSAVFASYPNLSKSGVNTYIFTADAMYTNNENIKYKVPFSLVCIRAYVEAIAVDGAPLLDYINFYFKTPDQIPSNEILKEEINKMASLLTQLQNAPVVQETYSGPVMFEGEAVGELISQCFVNNPNGVLASRKPITSTPTLTQYYARYLSAENNLEQLTGKKVVDRTLSVTAVYDKDEFEGKPLIGYHEFDVQGVETEKSVKIIENGVLNTLLTDRTPTQKSRKSNGHHCFAISDGSLTGTLSSGIIEISSSNGKSYKELKKKLIAAAKEEDYEYAYIVRKMACPMAGVPGLQAYVPNSNTGAFGISRPIYVYQISVKDGSEKLVRSAKISEMSTKSFKRIIGVTSKKQVYNTMQKGKKSYYSSWQSNFELSGAPASFIVPEAIVFQELEIEKDKNIILKKEPIVPNPILSNK